MNRANLLLESDLIHIRSWYSLSEDLISKVYNYNITIFNIFITSGAQRVTNTPTFRSGMKWTLAQLPCLLD